jgi:sigma-B regulation protein RsbU (phosphoserine phosphatase)
VPDDPQRLLTGTTTRGALVRRWITTTFAGRALVLGALTKVVAFLLSLAAPDARAVGVIDTLGDIALVSGAAVLAWRLFFDLRRLLLWRVRRKLTISYIFIGFVPALLIIAFFLLGGLLLFFNMGAYAMRTRLDALVEEARFLANSTALEMRLAGVAGTPAEILARRQTAAAASHPLASLAIVTGARTCADSGFRLSIEPATAGPWSHTPPPALPAWIACAGHAGLALYEDGGSERLTARAVAWIDGAAERAVIVDLPMDQRQIRQLRAETGITLGAVALTDSADDGTAANAEPRVVVGPAQIRVGDQPAEAEASERLAWVTPLDHIDWASGQPRGLMVEFRMALFDVYDRMSGTSITRIGDFTFGQFVLVVLAGIGVLFLIIQSVAFLMGLGLARSITGSVHELFVGTERVRRGDFSHKIAVRTRDQLGELAASFNSMTASIEDLLREKAEKERMEQELRIARSIQMSLLPQSTVMLPGIGLTAHCEPAREVGGDYYDFLPIDDHTLGILVADVSGKGTSAALYTAALKGIVLSLSHRHTSPREMLIEANQIISRHLDSRSFITVTYLLIDVQARTLQYARAGHCPMIYIPGPYAASRAPQILAPDGMVLGLTLDDGTMFKRLLHEVTLPLGMGDQFLLYTDGISEAMNADGDCFGDDRLAGSVHTHSDLPSDDLMARVLADVGDFSASTVQQDDMTMVLIRVEEAGVVAAVVT